MANNNNRYLIIGGIIVVLLLIAGVAYMMTQSNPATPAPTPTPAATATVTPTPVPGAGTGSEGIATATPTATATATPTSTATPTVTVTPTPQVTVTPTATPTPSADPYMAPGWPYYKKQYGPAPEHKTGTITAYVGYVGEPSSDEEVGVIPGNYGIYPRYRMGMVGRIALPLPDTWSMTGADGFVYLGAFDYGEYTVIYNVRTYAWQNVTIDDSHRNVLVTFRPYLPD